VKIEISLRVDPRTADVLLVAALLERLVECAAPELREAAVALRRDALTRLRRLIARPSVERHRTGRKP
jgi:hypothetical protein